MKNMNTVFKTMNLFLLVGLVQIATASSANAEVACTPVGCSGPAKELLSRVFPANTGNGDIILTTQPLVQALGCVGTAGGRLNIRLRRDANPSFEETYAIVLAASISNSNILIRVDETDASCPVLYIALLP